MNRELGLLCEDDIAPVLDCVRQISRALDGWRISRLEPSRLLTVRITLGPGHDNTGGTRVRH